MGHGAVRRMVLRCVYAVVVGQLTTSWPQNTKQFAQLPHAPHKLLHAPYHMSKHPLSLSLHTLCLNSFTPPTHFS